ncbi:MAG: lytic transglycosylase domain-containing protein [Candidatus Rokubacteria bacterium]|nr:lytic transglycosylase domain-containing protein [Candidatus Rokubacteria bacterium]
MTVVFPLLLLLVLAPPAAAETFRFTAPDGTVHFTNTPTDPRYQRMGVPPPSGTATGWLRLPSADLKPYVREIEAAAHRYGVSESLISAVIRIESGFNPLAISRKGARGLMQLMPGTASVLGVQNSFDPRENIDGGVRHLRGLIDRFGNDLPLALAAYNAGEQAVTMYRGVPPYPETRDYVKRIMQLVQTSPLGAATIPAETHRTTAPDGTVTYTNIPPRGRL